MNGGHHSYSHVFISIKGMAPGNIAALTSGFILNSNFLPLLTPKLFKLLLSHILPLKNITGF